MRAREKTSAPISHLADLSPEEQLRHNEDLYRELVENASDIIYTHDLEGNFTSINPAATQMTGYTLEEALSLNVSQIVAPEYLELARNTTRRKLAGLPVQSPYELDIVAKDGHRITLEVNTRLLYRDGTPVGVHGVGRDITDRKRTERALRESEAKFRSMAETSSCAIYILQGDHARYVNPASESITGYSREELLSMPFWQIFHPEDRDFMVDRAMARQRGESVPAHQELRIVTKDGQERWVDLSACLIPYEGNVAVLGTAFDITDRKSAEQEVQLQKTYLEHLFESAPEGIVVLDNAGRVMRANHEFGHMFGFPPGELHGRRIDDLIIPPDKATEAASLTRQVSSGKMFGIETVRMRKDGTLIDVSILGTPVIGENQQVGRYIIYRDISEAKRAEHYRNAQVAVTRILSESATPSEAMLRLVQALCEHLAWELGEFWEFDAVNSVLRWQDIWFTPSLRADEFHAVSRGVTCKPGSGFAGRCYSSGQPAWIAELIADADFPRAPFAVRAGLRSGMSFPVRGGKGVLGVISLFSRSLRPADPSMGRLLADIGSQIGQFIERKKAERALVESESKFRAVAETAASAIYIHTGSRFLYVNHASEVISGYSREELLTMDPFGLVHTDFTEMVKERAVARAEGASVPDRYEFKITRKDGSERWLDFSGTLIQFGGERAILATAFDITERKRAEQLQSALYRIASGASSAEKLEQFYATVHRIVSELMDARNFYIALHDAESDEIHFPYFVDEQDPLPPKSSRLGRGLTAYVLRSAKPLLATPEKFEELVNAGEVESVGAASIDWLGVPLTIGDQTIGALVVQSYSQKVRYGTAELEILTFVSQQVASAIEHKRSQEALQKSEARYRSLVQHAAYGIYRSDGQGRFLNVNPALVKMLGYNSEEEVLALDINRDVFLDAEQRLQLVNSLQSADRVEGIEAKWRRKDEKVITVRLSGRVVRDAAEKIRGVEMIAEDVTDRRALEDQLQHSQKMEAVGRLAGGVAHDFNNILTVIKGYSDLLIHSLPDGDPLRNEVDEIRKAADRAATLTRQLLAFSRRQVLAPKLLDLNSIVSNMEKLVRRLLGEDVELRAVLEPQLARVKADPGQIEQVIMNLAVNARDAMPRGGKLTIETANVELDDAYAREHAIVVPGAYVMLAVSDSGIGMLHETRAHIFEPFFTTKEQGKGTGLGLSTVYGIVKQSGGYIWVYSEPGQGTTFKVYLPRVDGAAEVLPTRPAQAGDYPGSETVLLVEDEEGVRALVRRVLERRGYHVLESSSGEEAAAHCQNHKGEIHLLLTDVIMTQINGRELARHLTQVRPDMKVLYISGYAEEAIVHHGVLDPGTAFLQKPFTTETLARKVREVLDGKMSS